MEVNKIYHGHVNQVLKTFPNQFFNTIITSPPYWNLRDYKVEPTAWPEITYFLFGQEIIIPAMTCCLGLEQTPKEFVGHMVYIMREARRVLKDDGTVWMNMGDSYAAPPADRTPEQCNGKSSVITGKNQLAGAKIANKIVDGLKLKDMAGIPWMLAFALREDGWYLRQDIIWHKPNAMPESMKDRCTKSHEYIFLLSKSEKYYYDYEAIKEDRVQDEDANTFRGGSYTENDTKNDTIGKRKKTGNKKVKIKSPGGWDTSEGSHGNIHKNGRDEPKYNDKEDDGRRNKRSVWIVPTFGFKKAHFATFPPKLIVPCVKAGCPVGGTVLDLFMGSGTTAIVSGKLGRKWVGIDLSETYIEDIANPRINKELGLFR